MCTCSILSADASMPGGMWAGLKANCSTSAKWFFGFLSSTSFPTGMRGNSECCHTWVEARGNEGRGNEG